MKICQYCGNRADDYVQYCPRCGRPFRQDSTDTVTSSFGNEYVPYEESTRETPLGTQDEVPEEKTQQPELHSCSVCYGTFEGKPRYCPHCGARVRYEGDITTKTLTAAVVLCFWFAVLVLFTGIPVGALLVLIGAAMIVMKKSRHPYLYAVTLWIAAAFGIAELVYLGMPYGIMVGMMY